ncbi:hypothetical protein CK203_033375 [Vitis vinifera]|uniref:Uncharacterized protein n=1 Tax=Vitis vinifera TaxID=29760 RepID=A0A438HMP0_VITVI|nr:hypothetical protein CK203_033375 [Vitis vinifera]
MGMMEWAAEVHSYSQVTCGLPKFFMHAVKDQSCVQHSGNGIGKCPLTCAIFNIFLSIIAALLHLNVHLAPRRAKIVEGDAKATDLKGKNYNHSCRSSANAHYEA